MHIYNIAVVGAGPAGAMAAIRSAQLTDNIALIERNDFLGKKLLFTGNGRCNITNNAPIEEFAKKFGAQGNFLKPAFLSFSNTDLIEFFETKGLLFKAEENGCVFPVTDKASSVVEVLEKYLLDPVRGRLPKAAVGHLWCPASNGVKIIYNQRVVGINKKDSVFELDLESGGKIYSQKVILSTGGASYKETGSSGDGLDIAKNFGHSIVSLDPALIPLKTKELWVKDLQGLALKNVRVSFKQGKHKITFGPGEIIFTHFGISGPLILDLSREIIALLKEQKEVIIFLCLEPKMTEQELDDFFLNEFKLKGSLILKNFLAQFLPKRLASVFLNLLSLDQGRRASQITKKQRLALVNLFKALPLTIIGALPLDKAMVTSGGVSTKEINPKTLESKIVPGLYFAGEIIQGSGLSGGYNLQQAFSTGRLAAENAVKS